MNNEEERSVRRAPTPSARRSIHHHALCIFGNSKNMGVYGLRNEPFDPSDEHENTSSSQDQGIDEVDNVMSKLAPQSSPQPLKQVPRKKKGRYRRDSLSTSDRTFTDDSESDSTELAKSLPAYLPSYYSSDKFVNESLPSDFYKVHNSITRSPSQPTSTDIKFVESHGAQKQKEYCKEIQNPHKQVLLPILGVIFLATGVFLINVFETSQGNNDKTYYDEIRFSKDIIHLGAKYGINDNSILEVQSGISTILERNDSGSFIFVYNGNSKKSDYSLFNNFMTDISSMAAQYLRSHSEMIQPTMIQSTQLNMRTHNELMNKYRNEVSRSGVLLVKDVDKIPPYLAMAFHYFCDEYNPLVAKSAIFFTLNLANCSYDKDQKLTHLEVEKCLADKWNTIPKDNITPLLARVVNVVIDVTNV